MSCANEIRKRSVPTTGFSAIGAQARSHSRQRVFKLHSRPRTYFYAHSLVLRVVSARKLSRHRVCTCSVTSELLLLPFGERSFAFVVTLGGAPSRPGTLLLPAPSQSNTRRLPRLHERIHLPPLHPTSRS